MPASEESAPRRSARVTLDDVARLAGVAPSTVSRALSRPGKVSTATAERVHAAAQALGYRSAAPRSPGSIAERERTGLIGVVVSDLTDPPYARLVRGVQVVAQAQGLVTVVVDSAESAPRERELIEAIAPRVDGMILASSRLSDETIVALCRFAPSVVLHRVVRGVDSAIEDTKVGIGSIIEHLASLGHHSLAYIPGPALSYAESERWRTLIDASRAASLSLQRVEGLEPTFRGGILAADKWAARPTSAVVAYNDEIAGGLLLGLARRGFVVPRDVSVVGMDNTPLGRVSAPPLTTLGIPHYVLGQHAARHLLARITHPAIRGDAIVRIPTRLIVRESTGPAPSAPADRAVRAR